MGQLTFCFLKLLPSTTQMGFSYAADDGPAMCFNAAKSWQLGWYSNRTVTVNPLSAGWSGKLVGLVDYQSTTGNPVLLKINTSTDTDYYMMFNRKAGLNAGTMEGADQIVIETQSGEGTAYGQSTLVAKLSAGGTYSISNFNSSGRTVTIKVNAISLTTTPAYASVSVSAASSSGATCVGYGGTCGSGKTCCSGYTCNSSKYKCL